MNNDRKIVPLSWWRVWVILVLIMAIGFVACGKEAREPLRAPTEETAAVVSIETSYGKLAFPEELYSSLRHMEVTEGQTAMEVFYMVSDAGEKELFRIYYADSQAGTLLGYLTTENGEISVSHSICEYAEESFADEEERKLYHSMMDAFSVIVNSIYEDARFSETRHLEPIKAREVKLSYWTVMLPENVSYEETLEGENYRVDFYGELSGERIDLYSIGLGDMQGESVLGQYTVNGVQKPVVVQTGDMGAYEIWPEEEQAIIYNMMSSLNEVIQTIVADENFLDMQPAA